MTAHRLSTRATRDGRSRQQSNADRSIVSDWLPSGTSQPRGIVLDSQSAGCAPFTRVLRSYSSLGVNATIDITDEWLTREDTGYHKGLHSRQLQMITCGAIGTGLFPWRRRPPCIGGPVCSWSAGSAASSVLDPVRARRTGAAPSVLGVIQSYAREFLLGKGIFVAGWMY